MIAKKHRKSAQRYYKITILPIPTNKKLGKVYFADKKDEEDRYPHEKATARRLVRFGSDVRFIKATNRPKTRTQKSESPDCWWNKKKWELKSPTGSTESNIVRNLIDGVKQCDNAVIDVARAKRSVLQAARDVMNFLSVNREYEWGEILVLDQREYCKITPSMLK